MFSIAQCASLACALEATAPKPGNVHRGADFEDLTFTDLLVSAVAIAPVMERAVDVGLGATILEAVKSTRAAVGSNANLGIVLLLGPLAAVPRDQRLPRGVRAVLKNCRADDARNVYAAIHQARPGGLGSVDEMDVAGQPPDDLLAAMRLAADRDLVARQYVNGFQEVFVEAADPLVEWHTGGLPLTQAIVHVHLQLMADYPDSLIARKCGPSVAQEAADRAARALAVPRDSEAYWERVAELDFWLRSDGHRRNPGTTADLLAAGLFVGLRENRLKPPFR